MHEQWRPVVGWEGLYEVSNQGRVRRNGRMLKPQPSRSGHYEVQLQCAPVIKRRPIHQLVLEAFVGPCPPGMECCHGLGGKTDNRVENLRWDTRSANMIDLVNTGTHNQASKSACVHGHDLTEGNIYRDSKGHRYCRACRKRRHRESNSHA